VWGSIGLGQVTLDFLKKSFILPFILHWLFKFFCDHINYLPIYLMTVSVATSQLRICTHNFFMPILADFYSVLRSAVSVAWVCRGSISHLSFPQPWSWSHIPCSLEGGSGGGGCRPAPPKGRPFPPLLGRYRSNFLTLHFYALYVLSTLQTMYIIFGFLLYIV
jgi:hypothetical protein